MQVWSNCCLVPKPSSPPPLSIEPRYSKVKLLSFLIPLLYTKGRWNGGPGNGTRETVGLKVFKLGWDGRKQWVAACKSDHQHQSLMEEVLGTEDQVIGLAYGEAVGFP